MKNKHKKVVSGVTAICCAAAVLVAGTFAWQAIANAINPFSDAEVTGGSGGNLHDDFDSQTGTKKIYVENTGDADIFVRVKLEEVFVKDSAKAPTTPDWKLHIPAGNKVADCEGTDQFHGIYGDAFTWTMGNSDAYSYKSIVDSDEWKAAVVKDDTEATRKAQDQLVGDALGSATSGSTIVKLKDAKTTEKTAPACSVITMKEYTKKSGADKQTFSGWVYDVDGYAYWSQPLAKDGTTGLLLNGVTLPTENSETYYYAINATMEYVDGKDIAAWTGVGEDGERTLTLNGKDQMTASKNDKGEKIKSGSQVGNTTIEGSTNAKSMLNMIAGNVKDLETTDAPKNLNIGDKVSAPTIKDKDGNTVAITQWESSNPSAVEVDSKTGEMTVKGTGTATITGKDKDGNEVTFEVTVTDQLTPESESVTVTAGGSTDLPSIKDAQGKVVDPKNLTWTSSDSSKVTVDGGTGKVTGVAATETPVKITGTDGNGNKAEFTVTVGAAQKTATQKLDEAVVEKYQAEPTMKEGCKIADDQQWPNTTIIPYYTEDPLMNSQDFGTIEDNYGVIELTKLLKESEYSKDVTFAAGERIVKIENGSLYIWYLPDYDDFEDGGTNEGYHPEGTIIATYTDPVTKETASKNIKIGIWYKGTILGRD